MQDKAVNLLRYRLMNTYSALPNGFNANSCSTSALNPSIDLRKSTGWRHRYTCPRVQPGCISSLLARRAPARPATQGQVPPVAPRARPRRVSACNHRAAARQQAHQPARPRTRCPDQASRMAEPRLSLSCAASNTGYAAPGHAASHTPPSPPTPAPSPLRGAPRILDPIASSLRLRKHWTKHAAAPTKRQDWV